MYCHSYNDFFGTLGNQTNQKIIKSLRDKSKSVLEIAMNTKLEQSNVSHALKRLAECRFVEVKQIGKHRFYSLNKETVVPILELADKHAKKMCPNCNKVENGSN